MSRFPSSVSSRPVRGLIFDVDGVLANTEPICARAASAMFRERYAADVPELEFEAYVGTGPPLYLGGPAREHGLDIDIEQAWADCANRFLALLDNGPDIAFPGTHAFLNEAFGRSEWALGLATSTPEHKSRKTLRAAGVDPDVFAAYVHGDAVARHKPDPEIYLAAAAALELAPGQCVVIEDAINGIRAAKGAGMRCVAVTNSFTRDRLSEADHVVDHVGEITWELLHALSSNGGT